MKVLKVIKRYLSRFMKYPYCIDGKTIYTKKQWERAIREGKFKDDKIGITCDCSFFPLEYQLRELLIRYEMGEDYGRKDVIKMLAEIKVDKFILKEL